MSWVMIGPTNTGGSRPYAVDPEYRDACVCDLYHGRDPCEVEPHAGEANLAALKAAGRAVDRRVEHVCDDHYERLMSRGPGDEEDES